MSKSGLKWIGEAHFEYRDKYGNLIEAWDQKNTLANGGQYTMLRMLQGTSPANLYIRLFNDTPTKTDELTDLTGEPSGSGYAAQSLSLNGTDFPTLALDSGDYKITTKTVTFLASGGTIPAAGSVIYMVVATSSDNTGKLFAYVALSTPRSLADGETLNITYSIKLS